MFHKSTTSPEEYFSRHNRSRPQQGAFSGQDTSTKQFSLSHSYSITDYGRQIFNNAQTISPDELAHILNKLERIIKHSHGEQQLANFNDIILALISVRSSILVLVAQHKFFTLLQKPFSEIIDLWFHETKLNENQSLFFRIIPKLLKRIFKHTHGDDFYPSWLLDSSFLEIIGSSFTNLSKSEKDFLEKSQIELKHFTRLFDIYIDYQERSNENNFSNKHTLIELIDPILHCLSSHHYIDLFDITNITKKTMGKEERFFLLKCPSFLLSYNGPRSDQVINSLLSAMLPLYIDIFNKIIPQINEWTSSTFQAVNYLLKMVNHKSANIETIIEHLPFIDHILTLVNTPKLYNNLEETLSNPETRLIDTAASFLAKIMDEPTILSYIKQKNVTSSFLRLTSVRYQPLHYNIHQILSQITSEKDIKSMANPGSLLSSTVQSLKTVINENRHDETHVEQLLDTLKGLVQHDQMKEELLKQDALPFLLDCANNFFGEKLKLLLETLWSLSFLKDAAHELRDRPDIIEKIQTISQTTEDEAVKKASEGLNWKLVEEPKFLKKLAKQQQEENSKSPKVIETTEVIVGEDGKKQVITKTIPASDALPERIFDYDMMISYCHADKDLVYRIHKFLKDQGFKIWIDLNNMFGPAMNAMAEAVENSEFVIMCMSESYKKSTYCQAEAEYAFNCKRRLVPLIVRPGYRADGWLGFMIGSRIYVDYGGFDFDIACEKLMTEIHLQKKKALPPKQIVLSHHEKPMETPLVQTKVEVPPVVYTLSEIYTKRTIALHFKSRPIHVWTESDVADFLYDQRLNEFIPLCEKMDGPALIQLYKMCESQRNETYALLNGELKSIQHIKLPLGVYTRFLSVMEQVVTSFLASLSYPPIVIEPPNSLPQIEEITSIRSSHSRMTPSYDILITSNASPLQILDMVHNCVLPVKQRSYREHRHKRKHKKKSF
ncbi:unnamed protein product [Rotaria sordida]|uniref:TIR domain-containing protein n=1 Tax=Rotaria sordida TaxID=392033 RepID=A0A819DY74_9BILA|nr:unnamed protein product [Rotaria sordida]CAF3841033.1 unnamed protein product [Rotaria sordida]